MGKKVVIVGGGFGGLEAAKALGNAEGVDVTVLDRKNHFIFQPLLYQVATASLSPSDIGAAIRHVLGRFRNVRVHLETAVSVDLAGGRVATDSDIHAFDYLVLACGSSHSYFGKDEWEDLAPGLKTIEQALEIRRRMLLALEAAEKEGDADRQRRLLTFVIIGGGPTGVELAGAVAELSHSIAASEFRNIRTEHIRVVLVQGGDRVLPAFSPELSEKARAALRKIGVEVMLDRRAEDIGPAGVTVGGDLIEASTVMWAAGVRPSTLSATLGVPLDRQGRLPVGPDLSVPGHPGLFVIGDQARCETEAGPLPGLAPVAMQQGRAAAANILADIRGKPRRPFRYRDKGIMAVIGRGYAVTQIGRLRLAGFPAWLIWIAVHIMYLIGHRNRLMVMINWAWSYATFKGGSRLITYASWKDSDAPRKPAPASRPAEPGTRPVPAA